MSLKVWVILPVVGNAFKSSFCVNMAPTFLVSGDGHDVMNCYHTLMLKEIHKLPKLVMIVFKKCAKLGMCGVTYVNVNFHIRVIRAIFQ